MMNTSSLTSQLNKFVITSFDENDREILLKLADIFVRTLSVDDGAFTTSGELNLPLIGELLHIRSANLSRTAAAIVKYIDPSGIVEYTPGKAPKKA